MLVNDFRTKREAEYEAFRRAYEALVRRHLFLVGGSSSVVISDLLNACDDVPLRTQDEHRAHAGPNIDAYFRVLDANEPAPRRVAEAGYAETCLSI